MTIRVAAPGKVVLWGEYAVLAGAPAAVMAVDRYARVELTPAQGYWRFSAEGFLAPAVHTRDPELPDTSVTRIARAMAAQLGSRAVERGFALHCDTRELHHHGQKLGIGSSAAATVATYVAIDTFRTQTPDPGDLVGGPGMSSATAIHRHLQSGGSGLDIAAAWHGGVIRFQQGEAEPWPLPDDLAWQVIWTGTAAATPEHLSDFAAWRGAGDTAQLDALCAAAEAVFSSPTLASLADYGAALRALDDAAHLHIYTQPHAILATIATDHGLVYKPCGAGGGDIGIAFGTDGGALASFRAAAEAANFHAPQMEIAPHGVRQI